MNADGDINAIAFLALDALDMDHKFLSVNFDNFGGRILLALTAHDLHLIPTPDRHTTDLVLCTKLLRQRGTHEPTPDV